MEAILRNDLMRKVIRALTALASLTIANSVWAGEPVDLSGASYEEIQAAADNDAIAWYKGHPNNNIDWAALMSIGKGRAINRGLLGTNTSLYAVEFESAIEAQANAAVNN
jgi:hypothetical protein